ncbi:sugar phosphate isomerase/epimerase [Alteromonas sp. D210916BOD_24]|uniref:sugar phosphate isomerase/epimerase family protein n=1 Tax=Alteromonas sp. D210916BOD_24 TaxID=3157618 RepID=UPI00399D4B32
MQKTVFQILVATILWSWGVMAHSASVAQETAGEAKISVQLYSVRQDLANDFNGTITTLSQWGIDGVEFAGDFGPYSNDPLGLKSFLNGVGLAVSGAHVSFNALKGDAFSKTVDFHTQLGTPYLIIPWDERAFSATQVSEVVSDLNHIAKQLQGSGIQVGFHNHSQELAPYNGSTFWDYIAKNTHEDVVLQLDVGWVIHAQKDPLKFITNYPSRIKTSHFKSELGSEPHTALSPLIGKDGVDWRAIADAGFSANQLSWIVVEQEVYPNGMSPMASLAVSVAGTKQMLTGR